MTLPFALRIAGPRGLWPARPWYHLTRAALLVAATGCFFLSLHWLPIADALAIFFVQPLIVTVLSALVLKERVGPRRWAAVGIGAIKISEQDFFEDDTRLYRVSQDFSIWTT